MTEIKNGHKRFTSKTRVRHMARVAVYQAVKAGILERVPCETCGATPSEAHHEDYTKPLDVKWVCKKHHMALHKGEKRPRKKKPCVPLLETQGWFNSRKGKYILRAGLRGILAKETATYKHWEDVVKPKLNTTRQKQIEREFRKRIQAAKIVIHWLTPYFERVDDVPTFVIRKEKNTE